MPLTADLSLLPLSSLDEKGLTAHIASRFNQGMPFCTISSRSLVAMNTFQDSDVNQEQVFKDLAARIWCRLQRRKEPQAAVFLGETGTGKTTFAKLLTRNLLSLSNTAPAKRAAFIEVVLDAFAEAKTFASTSASQSGTAIELQYDTEGSLIGSTILQLRANRWRVTRIHTNERNYNVFYYLIGGLTDMERYHLEINDYTEQPYRYLGHASQFRIPGVDNREKFKALNVALYSLGFSRPDVANIFQVLAAILHLGQIQFRAAPVDNSVAQTIAVEIVNPEKLELVADFLGVRAETLGTCLVSKTVLLGNDRVTVVLDTQGAKANADELAQTLYTLLTSWIIDCINSRLSLTTNHENEPNPLLGATVSVVDFPGFALSSSSTLDRILYNTANEMLFQYLHYAYFEESEDLLASEDVEVEPTEYFDNSSIVDALTGSKSSVLQTIDSYASREEETEKFLGGLEKRMKKTDIVSVDRHNSLFVVNHYAGEVEYSSIGLIDQAREVLSSDMISLFVSSSSSDFLQAIFRRSVVVDDTFGAEQTIVAAHLTSVPKRQLSRMRSTTEFVKRQKSQRRVQRQNTNTAKSKVRRNAFAATGQFLKSMEKLIESLQEKNSYFVLCVKPNDHRLVSSLDARCVRQQITGLGITELATRSKYTDHTIFMSYSEYLDHVSSGSALPLESERDHAIRTINAQGWAQRDAVCGASGILLSENAWLQITDPTMSYASEAARLLGDAPLFEGNMTELRDIDTGSLLTGLGNNIFYDPEKPDDEHGYIHRNPVDFIPESQSLEFDTPKRRTWLTIVWIYTWWVPDIIVKHLGRLKDRASRIAWREKFTINLIIWGMCIGCILFLIGFPYLICPLQDVFSTGQLAEYSTSSNPEKVYTSIRGIVYDITSFADTHYPSIVSSSDVLNYGGTSSTNLFPIQISAVCGGVNGTLSPYITMGNTHNTSDANSVFHDFRYFTGDYRPDWYLKHMYTFNRLYRKGYIGYTPTAMKKLVTSGSKIVASLDGYIYDVTSYINGDLSTRAPDGGSVPDDVNTQFMNPDLMDLFQQHSGQDITKYWKALSMTDIERFHMNRCLRNVFMIGKLDTQGSVRCLFARYFLLAVTCFVVAIILVKFLAALQFGSFEYPDDLDRFVICQVPAYTEDEKSLRRAIDSLARTEYDDKRKLLVVICDGMIVGAGNDRPTPRIVLDILGCPSDVNPTAHSFQSLGEGDQQHNMGKVYSGLYEVGGHIIPYLVIVKVGKPTEIFRPGNRGKRDSQMLLMRFLNRVHYDTPLNPLELEIYHQIQNVIGVSPAHYEFLMQVDADTVVSRESLSQLVAKMVRDIRIQGLCGETALSNARRSFITAMQVYEYYISHNLMKAFESLFGSVTCLPGCFSLYRLYEQDEGRPVFVSNAIVDAYSENKVRTLHSKNLLHLGEDRYLTTLMLKYNPEYSTKFMRHAQAWTVAPESWQVFVSQRRRWINSTVHNLVELVPMKQLCGCFFFGMRFMVIIDLFSTLIQPVTCAYIAYLIYLCVSRPSSIPYSSIALLGAIYGLQAIIFILRRRWDMVGWMFIYILAIPIFSLALPLYSFWYMDDFSWGSTRLVLGEKGKQLVSQEEVNFDPDTIPRMRWSDYQANVFGPEYDDQSMVSSTVKTNRQSVMIESHNPENYMPYPSDAELTIAVQELIYGSDLSTLTKASVRRSLEQQFGCSLMARRDFIGYLIEAVLKDEQ